MSCYVVENLMGMASAAVSQGQAALKISHFSDQFLIFLLTFCGKFKS